MGLSGCAASSGLSFGSSVPDVNAKPKSPSSNTVPAAAPAATINCFLVAPPRRPASDAVPENVGCGMATMLGVSPCEGVDWESAAGYWGVDVLNGWGVDVGATDPIGNACVESDAIGARAPTANSNASAISFADS